MTRVAVGTWLVALVLDAVALGAASGWCPSLCVCDTWYELQHASCTGRHLYSIHTGAPSIVQALDLSNNSISILNNHELAVSIVRESSVRDSPGLGCVLGVQYNIYGKINFRRLFTHLTMRLIQSWEIMRYNAVTITFFFFL